MKKNLRGIALVLTTKQGLDLVAEFANEGIKAELIHSKMKREEREDMFRRFRNHEFDVLVGMGIIIEGFDDPGVSVAIITYPVSSRVVMTQFPGRAERIDEDNPDKIAYIVNLAYKTKKQLFYTHILDGKSEVLQKKKRTKKLDMITREEFQSAMARKPDSYITAIAVEEEEVREIIRNTQGLDAYSEEELQQLALSELAKYGITDRVSLLEKGPIKFKKLDFGPFGKGTAFVNWLLTDLNSKVVTTPILEAIATRLGWEDKLTDEGALAEMAKHDITDRVSLLKKGSEFKKLDFGPFGKGHSFARWLLPNLEFKQLTTSTLEAIATRLGWEDKVKTDERALAELAKHDITNRVSLLEKGPKEFKKLDFGPFGKGTSFANWLLLDPEFKRVTISVLEAIADRLGWTDKVKTDERALAEMAKHDITDRVSLLEKGPEKFKKLDFGPFGKVTAFAKWLLPDCEFTRVTTSTLEAIAERLGWEDRVKTDERALAEMAKHGITNRVSLLEKGPTKFSKLDFGPFRKGKAFAKWLLPDHGFKDITTSILEAIATRLGWEEKNK